jgi:fucose permease
MASRLLTAFCLPPGSDMTLILGLSLASILVAAGVVVGRGRTLAVALVIAAGLAFGPVFPTLMGVLLGHTDPSLHGRVVGLFFAVGGIGWTAIPVLMGAYARRTSVQQGFLVAVASAVGLFAVALMLAVHLAGP